MTTEEQDLFKIYQSGDKYYKIDLSQTDAFKQSKPDAKEVSGFSVGDKKYDVKKIAKIGKVSDFVSQKPGAKPIYVEDGVSVQAPTPATSKQNVQATKAEAPKLGGSKAAMYGTDIATQKQKQERATKVLDQQSINAYEVTQETVVAKSKALKSFDNNISNVTGPSGFDELGGKFKPRAPKDFAKEERTPFEADLRSAQAKADKARLAYQENIEKIIASEINSKGVDAFRETNLSGDKKANPDKISAWANDIVVKNGGKQNGYAHQYLKKMMESAVDSYDLVKEAEKQASDYISKKYNVKGKGEDLVNTANQIIASANQSTKVLSDQLNEAAKIEMEQAMTPVNKAFKDNGNAFSTLNQQYKDSEANIMLAYQSGAMDEKTANDSLAQVRKGYEDGYKKLAADFDALTSQALALESSINNKYKARYRREVDEVKMAADARVAQIESDLKKLNADPKLVEDYRKAFETIYKQKADAKQAEIMARTKADVYGRGAFIKAFVPYAGPVADWMASIPNFLTSFSNGLGGEIERISSFFQWEAGEKFGADIATAFTKPQFNINSWKDLTDPVLVSGSAGQTIGGMAPMIGMQAITALATGGMSIPAQMAIQGGIGFTMETMSMAGGMYDDVFTQTGDVNKANEAANDIVKDQLKTFYLYALDGLPFINKITFGIKGKGILATAGRAGLKGVGETLTEIPQEFVQGGAEERAMMKTKDGKEVPLSQFIDIFNNKGYIDSNGKVVTPRERLESTALNVIPATLLTGGVGEVTQYGQNKFSETMGRISAIKSSFSEISPSFHNQYVFDIFLNRGEAFASGYVRQLMATGQMTKPQYENIVSNFQNLQEVYKLYSNKKVTKDQARVLTALSVSVNSEKAALASATNQIERDVAQQRYDAAKGKYDAYIKGQNGSFVIIDLPNGERYISSYEEFENMLGNTDFVEAAKENIDIRIVGDGKTTSNTNLADIAKLKLNLNEQGQYDPNAIIGREVSDIFAKTEIPYANQYVESVENRMQNAEEIPMDELNIALDNLYKQLETVFDTYYESDAGKAAAKILLDKIDQIKSYEFATDKETKVITETATVQTARDTVGKELGILQNARGPRATATITSSDGTTGTYSIEIDGTGNVTFQQKGAEPIQIGDVNETNKSARLVDAQFDEKGMPTSITFTVKSKDGNEYTINVNTSNKLKSEKLMDLAIDIRANEIGTVDPTAFDEALRTVTSETVETTVYPNIPTGKAEAKPTEEKPTQAKPTEAKPAEVMMEKPDVKKAIDNLQKGLQASGISVQLVEDPAEWEKITNQKGGSEKAEGMFMSAEGKIYLDRNKLNQQWGRTIIFHEGTHPIINIIRNTDPKLYNSVVNALRAEAKRNTKIANVENWANSKYDKSRQEDEFIVETMARIADGKIVMSQLSTGLRRAIIDLINKIGAMLGNKKAIAYTDYKNAVDLAKKITAVVKYGKGVETVVGAENVSEFGFTGGQERAGKMTLKDNGVGVTVTGTEDVITGQNVSTVFIKPTKTKGAEYAVDFTFDELMSTPFSQNSTEVTLAYKLAGGKISYKDAGEVVEFEFPYQNKNAQKQILKLRAQYSSIQGSSKTAKSEKEKIKKKIDRIAKDVFNDISNIMTQNILALYDTLSDEFISLSKEWYVGANRIANAIANKYNLGLEQTAGIIAALSPQNEWFNNVSVAERTIEILSNYSDTKLTKDIVDKVVNYHEGKKTAYPEDLKMVFSSYGNMSINEMQEAGISVRDQAVVLRAIDHAIHSPRVAETSPTGSFVGFTKSPVKWNSSDEISKAIRIFRNGSIEAIDANLGNGNKVRNFTNNILDPYSDKKYLTADTHAFSAAANAPISAKDASAIGLFNGGKEALYALVKDAYIKAADVVGILPREMQSITWEAQRTGINNAERTKSEKELSFEYIRNTRTNEQTPYEKASELIAKNRSSVPGWAEQRGINVQRGSNEISKGARDRANKRIREIQSLRGRLEGGRGAAISKVGRKPSGRTDIQEGLKQESIGGRTSPQEFSNNVSAEVERIKAATEETGVTLNLDGTTYKKGGLVVPAGSLNVPQSEVSVDGLLDFIEQNRDKISSDIFKVGLYRFKNRPEVSYDLNIVIPNKYRDIAIEFGRLAGQESLFDLNTFENIKTGSDGKNPIEFNAEQLASIAQDLSSGRMPSVVQPSTGGRDVVNQNEINEIIAKAKENGTYLKAPNGKDTLLTPFQWAQVRTKAFKNWFGDWENDPKNSSKIVNDITQEPMVLYHGTSASDDFDIFKTDKHKYAFFSTSPYFAEAFAGDKRGRIYPVFLNIRKLFDPEKLKQDEVSGIYNAAFEYRIKNGDSEDGAKDFADSFVDQIIDNDGNNWPLIERGYVFDYIQENNFDGIFVTEEGTMNYAVNNPNQIKSAISNIGDFSTELPNIQASTGNRDLVSGTYYEPNLTTDKNGNYVFFHVSNADPKSILKGIDSRKFQSLRTSREEKGLQYGIASFYTKPTDGERVVGGDKYYVTIKPEDVYPMDTDPNGYRAAAVKKIKEGTPFREEKIKKAIADAATKDGYQMAVGEWTYDRAGRKVSEFPALRGDALVKLVPKAYTGNENFTTGEERGVTTQYPGQAYYAAKQDLSDIASDIESARSKKNKYDDVYEVANNIKSYGGIIENYGTPNEMIRDINQEEFDTLYSGATPSQKKSLDNIQDAYLAGVPQFSVGGRGAAAPITQAAGGPTPVNVRRRGGISVTGLRRTFAGPEEQDLRDAILADNRSYYTPTSWAKIKDKIDTMSEADLIDQMDLDPDKIYMNFVTMNGPSAPLAFVKYYQLMRKRADEARAIGNISEAESIEADIKDKFLDVKSIGTVAAKTLSMFRLLKSTRNDAEFHTDIIEAIIESTGGMLSKDQRTRVLGMVQNALSTNNFYEGTKTDVYTRGASAITPQDLLDLKIAEVWKIDAAKELNIYISILLQDKAGDIYGSSLKGHLLGISSMIISAVSNILNMPNRAAEQAAQRQVIRIGNMISNLSSGKDMYGRGVKTAFGKPLGTRVSGMISSLNNLLSSIKEFALNPFKFMYNKTKGIREDISERKGGETILSAAADIIVYGNRDNSEKLYGTTSQLNPWISLMRVLGKNKKPVGDFRSLIKDINQSFKKTDFIKWLSQEKGMTYDDYSELGDKDKVDLRESFFKDKLSVQPVTRSVVKDVAKAAAAAAEFNFRVISLTDYIPRNIQEKAMLDRIASTLGLTGVDKDLFMHDPYSYVENRNDIVSKEVLNYWDEYAAELTLTKKTFMGSASVNAANLAKFGVRKFVRKNKMQDTVVGDTVETAFSLATDILMPFVQLPMNATSYALDFAWPWKSWTKAVYFNQLSRQAKKEGKDGLADSYDLSATKYISRGFVGSAYIYLAMQIISIPGLIALGSGEDDDDEERKINKDMPRNRLNISAFNRYIKGLAGIGDGDTRFRQGEDKTIDLMPLGVLGMMIYAYGNAYKRAKTKYLNQEYSPDLLNRDIGENKTLNNYAWAGNEDPDMFSAMMLQHQVLGYYFDQAWYMGIANWTKALTAKGDDADYLWTKATHDMTGTAISASVLFSNYAKKASDVAYEMDGRPLPDLSMKGVTGYDLPYFGEFAYKTLSSRNGLVDFISGVDPYKDQYLSFSLFGKEARRLKGAPRDLPGTIWALNTPTREVIGDWTEMERYYAYIYGQRGRIKLLGNYSMDLKEPYLGTVESMEIPGEDLIKKTQYAGKFQVPAEDYNQINMKSGRIREKLYNILSQKWMDSTINGVRVTPEDIDNPKLSDTKQINNIKKGIAVAISESNRIIKDFLRPWSMFKGDGMVKFIGLDTTAQIQELNALVDSYIITYNEYDPESNTAVPSYNYLDNEEIRSGLVEIAKQSIDMYVRELEKSKINYNEIQRIQKEEDADARDLMNYIDKLPQ